MNILALDTETPKFDDKEPWRGSSYSDPNDIVCWSEAESNTCGAWRWCEQAVSIIQEEINKADLLVFFNGKHDVAWLRRYGVDFTKVRIWDVQLAEFVIGRQLNKFPSLADTCSRYGIATKLDQVKTEFWDKGIDTKDIPWDILRPYAAHDAAITLECYHAQLKHMTVNQIKLVKLMSADMLVLQEMEQNGIKYNEELCAVKAKELDDQISAIEGRLSKVYPTVPINFNSPDMLSAFLYGGTIVETIKVHDGFYKSGAKAGQPKLSNKEVEHCLPRLFEPVKGSELKKAGLYGTSAGVLGKIKALRKENQWVVQELLRLATLETLNSKYYIGLPALNKKMRWPKEKLHGNFNQTLAETGRLSSNKPNQQNFASELQDILVSEYP